MGHELDDCAAKMYKSITVVILSDNMLICFQLIENHVCFLYLFSLRANLFMVFLQVMCVGVSNCIYI